MSQCIHCGDCCRFLSPLTDSEEDPCPHLIEAGPGLCSPPAYLCAIYHIRPEQCRAHSFNGHRWCPIGLSVVQPAAPDVVARRIDAVFEYVEKELGEA